MDIAIAFCFGLMIMGLVCLWIIERHSEIKVMSKVLMSDKMVKDMNKEILRYEDRQALGPKPTIDGLLSPFNEDGTIGMDIGSGSSTSTFSTGKIKDMLGGMKVIKSKCIEPGTMIVINPVNYKDLFMQGHKQMMDKVIKEKAR